MHNWRQQLHRRRHPSCKTPTSHGGGVGEIHGVPPTCLGEVSDLSETSPRRLGEVSGIADVSGKSWTSRGSLGEVRVMEFGLYAAFMHIIARQKRSSTVDFLTSRYFFGREGQRSNIKAAKTPKSFFLALTLLQMDR